MYEVDVIHADRWSTGRSVMVSTWRHGRPTPTRIGQLVAAAPGVSDHDRIERIGAWEKIVAWAQAHQYAEVASFVDNAATDAAAEQGGFSIEDAVTSAEAEIALVLHTTTRAAGCRADEARELRHRFPATMTALLGGRITRSQARAIADGSVELDEEQALALEQHVLGRAGRQTLGQLREAVRRAVTRIDPAAAERRHQRKRRDRKVVLYPERDGMATLAATLPATEAVGVYAVLDQHARACTSGDGRSMDNRRADALVDLVLGETGFLSTGTATTTQPGDTDTAAAHTDSDTTEPEISSDSDEISDGQPGTADEDAGDVMPRNNTDRVAWGRWLTGRHRRRQPASEELSEQTASGPPDPSRLPALAPPGRAANSARVQVQIRVTVPLDVLTGQSEAPAELAGYGPLPASMARDLAADPDSTWYRLITDPLSGALLDHGTTRYRPPPALSQFVNARHQTCQFPGCRMPAHRCDLDHNIPFDPAADSGPTSAANLGPKCRPHHRLKGMPGWEVHQYPDGTIVWRTPSGHTYLVEPPPLTEPARRPPAPPPVDDTPAPF